MSSQEVQKKPETNQTEVVVNPIPELHNSSVYVGANYTAENGTASGSTNKLNGNGNISTNEVDQSKISEAKNETVITLNTSILNSSEKVGNSGNSSTTETGTKSGRRLLEDAGSKESNDKVNDAGSKESDNKVKDEGAHMATVENDGGLEADADSAFDFLRDNDELGDEESYDYDDYVDESMWGGEEWVEGEHENSEDYVNIDAHILCTPVS